MTIKMEKIAPLATIGSFALSIYMFFNPFMVFTLSAVDGISVSGQTLGIFFLLLGFFLLRRNNK